MAPRLRPHVQALEDRRLPTVLPLFYSIDGSGNNLTHWTWGAANTDLIRIEGSAYGNGIATLAQAGRPGPRVVSNTIAAQAQPLTNNRDLSDMIYAWGQFIDHDLDLTPAGTTESAPIAVPKNDSVFKSAIPFLRSVFDPTTGTSKSNPREQPTTVTAFLDGSVIYGSDAARAAALRTFVGGKLKTSAGNLPPLVGNSNLPEDVDIPGINPSKLFLTGDVRGNENIELVALETLFIREHNFWAGQLKAEHPRWTDLQLYQGARQIVIAEIQNITYTEFLPALLGPGNLPVYRGYNPKVDPSIDAAFSEAAYRVGHTLLNQEVDFFNNDGSESHDPLSFNSTADNPAQLHVAGTSVDTILKYLTANNAQEVDNQVQGAFRNLLFDPTNKAGLDLYAIDIQRGRDVGLPDYNTARVAFGLPRVTSFNQITSNPTLQAQLRHLYGTTRDAHGALHDNVNKLDMFVGGLAENHQPGGSLGPLFTRIIADQFKRLRDGDRLFYLHIFSGADLQRIENTTLADIIARDSSAANLQANVFFFSTGTISGQVFSDANHNGRFTPGEHGVARVTVDLLNAHNQVIATTTTAPNGTYQFSHVATKAIYHLVVLGTSSLKQSAASRRTVRLVDNGGAGVFGVELGLLPLARSASAESD